jgi:hypothetical protein
MAALKAWSEGDLSLTGTQRRACFDVVKDYICDGVNGGYVTADQIETVRQCGIEARQGQWIGATCAASR